ncbi:MAG: DUF1564 domain-containing protein [Leptospiraceae bacterium]|nr:DUF1564 domain-containing protein [Leptospiraceae bacterium]
MKYQFILSEQKQSLNLKSKSKTVSTLRVPKWLNSTVKKGILKYGNLTKYLNVLLIRYRFLLYSDYFQPSENPKTEYQERGQTYVTWKFRPENRDWLELKMWGDALGISATFMFVKLLEIEAEYESTVSEKTFRFYSYVLTTVYYARVPQLRKALRKGRSILERGITFYNSPEKPKPF